MTSYPDLESKTYHFGTEDLFSENGLLCLNQNGVRYFGDFLGAHS